MTNALARTTALCLLLTAPGLAQGTDFVHWETAHVHPLDITPDGSKLLAVNTADDRLEVFDLTGAQPTLAGAVQVGVDPVTVRVLDNSTAWVVNHISDTISVVDLTNLRLTDTIHTPDEPSDVVFSGSTTTGTAWVSCAQPNLVAVFSLANLTTPPTNIPILGEDPKSMAISPSGSHVYVAIHTSGNNTTILNGGTTLAPNIVSDPAGPYSGVNPPPNSGVSAFVPPIATSVPPPAVSLIVRKDSNGQWLDDNVGNWTSYVSGANANAFGRIANWDLYDHDVAVIDTATQSVTYATGAMNIVMGIAVLPANPGPGHFVTVVGTDATNEVRFEPNLRSRFVRVKGAAIDPAAVGGPATLGAVDLNPILATNNYVNQQIPQSQRDQSLGDPRAMIWDPTGSVGWVAGMGSNNVARIDPGGNRYATIEVGSGPTGLSLDLVRARLYVLNKFTGSISVVDVTNDTVLAEVPFFDPTPLAVKRGRKHLYDTHRTSGLGQTSCASCHINGTIDNLAWDLGDPSGDIRWVHSKNLNYDNESLILAGSELYHPMKGPMTTQTLQDIIGKEPFHWRGDKKGIEEFNGAFVKLLGDDILLSAAEMQEFEDFLASIWMPPNPHRFKNNTFNTALDLTPLNLHYKHPTTGAVTALTTGDAQRGFDLFMPTLGQMQDGVHCVTCHTNPVGVGPDLRFDAPSNTWLPIPAGAHGELHSAMHTQDPNTQRPLKIPQLRNMHKKTGFDLLSVRNTAGFGYIHDGVVDTISHFLSEPVFLHTPGNEVQDVADLAALMLSYSGSGFPAGSTTGFDNPPGPVGLNSHAGVGFQWTVKQGNPISQTDADVLNAMFAEQANSPNDVAIIVKQNLSGGGQRGFAYLGSFNFQTDTNGTTMSILPLIASIGPGTEATFTAVPAGTEIRAGVDRDADGFFDATEAALGTNPDSARSVPPGGLACGAVVPAAPSNVTAASTSAYAITVSWTDNSSNETGFAIERSWSNSPQWELVADVGPNLTSYFDPTVGPSTGYLYRVRSYNCKGESATATMAAATTTPAQPATVDCHVHAIDLQTAEDTVNGIKAAYGTVNVVDDQGRTVAGATVTCTITGPSGPANTMAISSGDGQAFFAANFVPITTTGTWTFTVTGISGAGFNYVPGANFVTSNTVQ